MERLARIEPQGVRERGAEPRMYLVYLDLGILQQIGLGEIVHPRLEYGLAGCVLRLDIEPYASALGIAGGQLVARLVDDPNRHAEIL